jgi:hypothetical protein
VTSIIPSAGPTAGGNTVTIDGTNFAPGATVHFGAVAAAVSSRTSTQITAIAPAQSSGTADVTVTTSGGTSATSAADEYIYDAPPTLSSVNPDSGSTVGGNKVAINGTNFVSGATVKFGSSPGTSVTFVSSTQLTALAPARSGGSVDVTVTTPGGTSAKSITDLYAYGRPTISSFTPSSGITGSTVTMNGTGFVPGVTVRFGTLTSPKVTVSSGTQLNAVVPNGAVPASISVGDPQGAATSISQFTPTFSITGFSPSGGPAGTVVTITGIGFNTTVVNFNGTAASSVTLVSPSELQATVPSGATTGPITVTNLSNPTGTVQSAASFTVT